MAWERDSDREENTDTRFLREGSHERPRKRRSLTSDVDAAMHDGREYHPSVGRRSPVKKAKLLCGCKGTRCCYE